MSKNIFKTKKFKFFAIFCVCLIVCFVCFKFTRAADKDSGMEQFIVITVGTCLNWIASFLGWVVGLAGNILDWTLDAKTLGLLTNNEVINIGWVVIRDVVNMLFIVILLVVAFAKVLGISAYQNADRVIIRLVIAALLINFSKVLCGFLIDASGVLTMYFVKGGSAGGTIGENLANALSIQNLFASGMKINGQSTISGTLIITSLIFTDIILLVSAAAFLMLAIMLVVRMVNLWILVMISPLAWAGFITGGNLNPKVFNGKGWWNAFIGYITMAPVAAFYLYVAIRIASTPNLAGLIGEKLPTGQQYSYLANSFSMLMQYAIVITLMVLGYQSAKASGEIVTKFAGGQIEDAGKKVLGWDWGKGFGKGALTGGGAVGAAVGAAGAGAGYAATGLTTIPGTKTAIRGLQKLRMGAEKTFGIGEMIGGPGAYRQAQVKKYEEVKKTLGGKTADELLAIINQVPEGQEGIQRRMAAITQLAEKDSSKLTPAHKDMIKKLHGIELGADAEKEIMGTRPDWALDPVFGTTVNTVLAKIKPSKTEKIAHESFTNPTVQGHLENALHTNASGSSDWTPGHLRNLAQSDNVQAIAEVSALFKTISSDPIRFARLHPKIQHFLITDPVGKTFLM